MREEHRLDGGGRDVDEPTGARLSLSPWDNTFVGENGVRLREGTLWDVNFNSTVFQEELCVGELDGLTLEDALLKVEPAAQALGITLGAAPHGRPGGEARGHRAGDAGASALGLPPEQTIILDWTAKDEHYKLLLPQYYHGLRIFPTQGFIPGRENTPQSCVGVIVGREGLEYLQANFVPGAEKAQGAPFAPIPVEQALETGLARFERKRRGERNGKRARVRGLAVLRACGGQGEHDAVHDDARLGLPRPLRQSADVAGGLDGPDLYAQLRRRRGRAER